jgi:hypothetical protein
MRGSIRGAGLPPVQARGAVSADAGRRLVLKVHQLGDVAEAEFFHAPLPMLFQFGADLGPA